MITVLGRIFLKNRHEEELRKGYGLLCSIVGIVLNILLFGGKYLAGTVSGSVAITADAFNNLSDAGSSFITLVGFLFAGKEPDIDHPFGHGRFEYVSGLLVAMAIILMGFELLTSSVSKIVHPEKVETGVLTIVILVISILVKLYMAFYNKNVGSRIGSAAMKATSADSLSDAVATSVVLISVIFVKLTAINIDGYCGVLVAVFILWAGYNAAKDTLDPLLGSAPDPELVNEIREIVMSHRTVAGIHDMVIHDYGPGRVMISLHAEVPGDGNIYELHDMIDCIERELREKLHCEAVIHMDPIETDNEEIAKMRNRISQALKQKNNEITIHDFRMVRGSTHTNVIFDAVIPYEMKIDEKAAEELVEKTVKEIDPALCPVITIDRQYVK